MLRMEIKPKICNVVSTADLKQKVNINELSKLPCGIFDESIYGGRCGYVKIPEMKGRVTIFASGKMISIGGNSVTKAHNQLNQAKFYLVQENLIQNTLRELGFLIPHRRSIHPGLHRALLFGN